MKARTFRRFALPMATGLCLAWLAAIHLGANYAAARTPQEVEAAASISRPQDPVVVAGASFPAFANALTGSLALYAYRSGIWTPIPFQIDEVSITGTYVVSDGGLLDANDELVFMAGDAGDSATGSNWPADPQSRIYARYAITLTDPLSPTSAGWAYLYRSTTLPRSSLRYITWTESAQTMVAVSYTASFSPTEFIGLSNLAINGTSVDILDRQKIRATALFGTIILDEENLPDLIPSLAASVTFPAIGPVRAVSNNGAFYGAKLDINASLTFDFLSPDFIRTSFDWNDPAVTGITRYRDSNTPGTVTIDGVTDTVASTPRITWAQVNGNAAGPGGIVVAIPSVNPGMGTTQNYYKDNGIIDANDKGDKMSFGDVGVLVNNPGGAVGFTIAAYILPPGTTASVGATYFSRATNPLASGVGEQCFTATGSCTRIYLPLIRKN